MTDSSLIIVDGRRSFSLLHPTPIFVPSFDSVLDMLVNLADSVNSVSARSPGNGTTDLHDEASAGGIGLKSSTWSLASRVLQTGTLEG